MKRSYAALTAIGLAMAAPVLMQTTTYAASAPMAEQTVSVGGQAMYPTKTIVGNAVNSADHTTLVAAVKAAGLVATLSGPGPFTVFAPTNEAFTDLPAGTVDTLLKPENKPMLTKVLTYHVVSGDYDSAALRSLILAGGGKATLKTVEGGTADLHDERLVQHRRARRQGRCRRHHDFGREAVERRDPRRRQSASARLRFSDHSNLQNCF